MKNLIRNIIVKALDIGRYAQKSDDIYSFLDDNEREEMAETILKKLKEEGYRIQKIKKKS